MVLIQNILSQYIEYFLNYYVNKYRFHLIYMIHYCKLKIDSMYYYEIDFYHAFIEIVL